MRLDSRGSAMRHRQTRALLGQPCGGVIGLETAGRAKERNGAVLRITLRIPGNVLRLRSSLRMSLATFSSAATTTRKYACAGKRSSAMKYHLPISATAAVSRSFLTTMPDEILIALIATHDKNAMHVLYIRHNIRVFRFLTRLLRDAATAEDLVSEVFIEVWRNAGQFEARSKVSTWILAIARFKAAAVHRRRRPCDQLDESVTESLEDQTDGPDVTAQKRKCSAILRSCLEQLSPAHREVLDLIYYHEQSIANVAQIVGVPQNTVKTRAFHARKRVAQLMAARGIERAWL
jgi:RNA polymerase sigma-70 factor, ECF subfamily